MAKLYHSAVYLPETLSLGSIRPGLALRYSAHALHAAADDRVNPKALPSKLPKFNLIEVEAEGSAALKSVVRCSFTRGWDLVLVVLPDGFVKTLWLNASDDQHSTLNRSHYATN